MKKRFDGAVRIVLAGYYSPSFRWARAANFGAANFGTSNLEPFTWSL